MVERYEHIRSVLVITLLKKGKKDKLTVLSIITVIWLFIPHNFNIIYYKYYLFIIYKMIFSLKEKSNSVKIKHTSQIAKEL